MTRSRRILPAKRWWKPEEEAYLREHYADTLTTEIARHLGCAEKRVLSKAHAMGLHKSRALIAEIGRLRTAVPGHGAHRTVFQPGSTPWNKGKPYVAGGRSADTRFRPGSKPHTTLPLGSHRIVINKSGGPVLERKISDEPGPSNKRWHTVHRLVWEAEHGPCPLDHVIVFKPGRRTLDPALITLDAVECITREQLMERNSIHRLPPEFAEVARLKGQLVRAINHKTKATA